VKFLIEEVEVDTMHDVINVKHIIPLDLKMCQLRSGGNISSTCKCCTSRVRKRYKKFFS